MLTPLFCEFTIYPFVVFTLFLHLTWWYDMLSGMLHLQVDIDDYVAAIKPPSFAVISAI
jgi:hypothetical protein